MINLLKTAIATFAVSVLAACATPATNETVDTSEKIAASMEGKMTDDGTVVVCRSMQVTGSRFPAKECKSEKVWKEFDAIMAENAKSSTDRIQRVNSGCANGPC